LFAVDSEIQKKEAESSTKPEQERGKDDMVSFIGENTEGGKRG